MRAELEIAAAHDRLVAILQGEMPFDTTPQEMETAATLASVLCWVLQHDHNPRFQQLLDIIDARAAAHGLVLQRADN